MNVNSTEQKVQEMSEREIKPFQMWLGMSLIMTLFIGMMALGKSNAGRSMDFEDLVFAVLFGLVAPGIFISMLWWGLFKNRGHKGIPIR